MLLGSCLHIRFLIRIGLVVLVNDERNRGSWVYLVLCLVLQGMILWGEGALVGQWCVCFCNLIVVLCVCLLVFFSRSLWIRHERYYTFGCVGGEF